MKRIAIVLAAVAGVAMFMIAVPTEVSAELIPCCEGGFKPDKKCNTDANCPDVCDGGSRDGKNCASGNCPDACVGGSNDGNSCSGDVDCPGGTCSDLGTCMAGTCTGLCEKKRPKPSPSEPISVWDEVLASDATERDEDTSIRPCP